MRKVFNFGCIDYTGNGRADNLVKVTVEYQTKGDKKVFSASGEIWQSSRRDILAGGQCLDTIAEYITAPEFVQIFRLWKMYHLNDMHPECEHQNALGWTAKAGESVTIYEYTQTTESITEKNRLERDILQAAREGRTYQTTPHEQLLLGLSYSYKTHAETLPEEIGKYYKLRKTEQKLLGWLHPSDHPDGILCKPCPVCGYKYGSAWNYQPIPAEDEKTILQLLNN